MDDELSALIDRLREASELLAAGEDLPKGIIVLDRGKDDPDLPGTVPDGEDPEDDE